LTDSNTASSPISIAVSMKPRIASRRPCGVVNARLNTQYGSSVSMVSTKAWRIRSVREA
jgi:hypothetical protein